MANMSSAQLKGFGRVADTYIDLSADEELDWSGFWVDHPINILARIQTDFGRHDRHQHMRRRAQRSQPDPLAS